MNHIQKSCFLCEHLIDDSPQITLSQINSGEQKYRWIAISSITHSGLKYNIQERRRKKMGMLSNPDYYSQKHIHISCCEKIMNGLDF